MLRMRLRFHEADDGALRPSLIIHPHISASFLFEETTQRGVWLGFMFKRKGFKAFPSYNKIKMYVIKQSNFN